MTVAVTSQVVQPLRLMRVRYSDEAGEHEVTAISCRYLVAVNAQGQPIIATELVVDPSNPFPQNAYIASTETFSRILIAPSSIKGLRPYLG